MDNKISRKVYKCIKRKNRNEDLNMLKRDEWIKHQLESLPEGLKIIDAGAGELKWKSTCKHLQYVSQDFCQYDGSGNEKGLQMKNGWDTSKIDIVSDISNIPVEDGEFDVVLCSEVFEHIASPELALKEFGRILHKDGVLILTAPFCSLTHMAPYHFCTGFNKYWYEIQLEKYGFEIEVIETNGNYFSYMRQELVRLPYVIEQYIGKKDKMIRFFSAIFRQLLNRYTEKTGADDLLCFGYHVVAKKCI